MMLDKNRTVFNALEGNTERGIFEVTTIAVVVTDKGQFYCTACQVTDGGQMCLHIITLRIYRSEMMGEQGRKETEETQS